MYVTKYKIVSSKLLTKMSNILFITHNMQETIVLIFNECNIFVALNLVISLKPKGTLP